MKGGKKFLLVQILKEFKSGLSPAKISEKLKISKQNLNYYVGKLKKAGCIKKKGYGVWECIMPLKEVKKDTYTHSDRLPIFTSQKEIRSHAFIWRVQFEKKYNWDQAIRNYHKKKLTFQFMRYNKLWRTILDGRKIWLGNKGLTIYETRDYFGKSSFEGKGKAIFEMDLLIKNLLQELGLKFSLYRFTTSREHYGIVKNELARQYNDKKEKMMIRSEDGSIWMWIDDSKSLGELENCDPTINRKVQNFWNDHKKKNFEVDASFVLNGFNNLTNNLNYYAENMRSHVDAVKELGNAVKILSKKVEEFGTHTK